jgi:hypothetical protein
VNLLRGASRTNLGSGSAIWEMWRSETRMLIVMIDSPNAEKKPARQEELGTISRRQAHGD